MDYRIVVSHSGENLTDKVMVLISEGWEPLGSHQTSIRHIQNRFRGDQHIDSLYDIEYSQTLIKRESQTK